MGGGKCEVVPPLVILVSRPQAGAESNLLFIEKSWPIFLRYLVREVVGHGHYSRIQTKLHNNYCAVLLYSR